MKKKKGFTLVELIAVIGISAIFGAIVLSIALTSGKLFNMAQTDSVNNDKARLIIGTMEDDLRTAKNIYSPSTLLPVPVPVPVGSLTIANSVSIGTKKYEFSSPVKVVVACEKSNGEVYAYTYSDTSGLTRMKFDTTAIIVSGIVGAEAGSFKPVSGGYTDINDINVTKNGTDKSYTIVLKFDSASEYSSVITPRN